MASVSVNLAVLGIRDALQIRYVVVKRVIVLVMNKAAVRHGAVMVLPYSNVERDLFPVAVLRPSPEVHPPTPLLGVLVSVVLPAVEYDGFRA